MSPQIALKVLQISLLLSLLMMVGCSDNTAWNSDLKDLASDSGQSMFVKIGPEEGNDTYSLLVSTHKDVVEVSYCEGADPCNTPFATQFVTQIGGRKIFRTVDVIQLTESIKLKFESKENETRNSFLMVRFKRHTEDSGTTPDEGSDATDYDWEKHIKFVDVPEYQFSGNTYGSAHYRDVMTHVKEPYLQGGALTAVHESHHFLLHENDGRTPAQDKFVYHRAGQGTFYLEPKTKTVEVEAHLPQSIIQMAKLYKTYIQSRPTQSLGENIVDEWQAYIAESISLIEATNAGAPMPNDSVEGGAAEFLYFNAVALQVLYEKEPEHLKKDNVKAIFAMLAEKSRWIHDHLGKDNQLQSSHTKEVFEHLQSHPDSLAVRKALIGIFGAKWTNRVLGF